MRRGRVGIGVAALLVAAGTSLPAIGATPSAGGAPLLGHPLPDDVLAASASPGSSWTPDPASYDVGKTANVAVTMPDGVNLQADIYYPMKNGERAAGEFPVILTQTPYGRQIAGQVPGSVVGDLTGNGSPFLVQRGYISVVADVRGTGASEGSLGLADPVIGTDGAALVDWAAALPGSNGKVGTTGSSFLAVTQLFTAGAVGKDSPLKAIFPVLAPNDTYKDLIAMGGLLNSTSDPLLPGLTGVIPAPGPVVAGLNDPRNAVDRLNPEALERLQSLAQTDGPFVADLIAGRDVAFNGEYWQERSPGTMLQRIADNGVAAYLVGTHYDLWQRGHFLNYSGLQNAYAGRPVDGPMAADQPATGRYQLLVTGDGHLEASFSDFDLLQLRWFDTWLKDRDTGMANTPTPLHVYDLGTGSYRHGAQYPFPAATPTRFYLDGNRSGTARLSLNDGTLSTTPPSTKGADTVPWLPVGNPCNRAVDQRALGAINLLTNHLPIAVPCLENDAPNTLGLDRLAYTSAPMSSAQTIAGPITMTVYASANRAEAAWVVQVDDVAPDGTSKPLTKGALLGSLRELDPATTWRTPTGEILQAGHAYTRDSQQPVKTGETTRYDIEVSPTFDTVAKGHRIRITLSTADTPHLMPTIPAMIDLFGGIYSVKRTPDAPSSILLPLVPAW